MKTPTPLAKQLKNIYLSSNKMHFIYKPDGSPVGWYARNVKTLDDIFLGAGASPTIELESVDVENTDAWNALKQADETTEEAGE